MSHKLIVQSFRSRFFLPLYLLLLLSSCTTKNAQKNYEKSVAVNSAFVYGFRMESPENTDYYIGVYNQLIPELNPENATKLGPNRRIWSYGEHPYIWNGDSSTIMKLNVSRSDLSITEGKVVSFADQGISGNLGEPVFYSNTKAFFFALKDGKVAEFNPSDMTISKIHQVEPIRFEGHKNGAWFDSWHKYIINDKIILPIGFIAGSEWILPDGAMIAVFDPLTGQLSYQKDQRLQACHYSSPFDGKHLYIVPGYALDAEVHYSGKENPLPTQNLLRLTTEGNFDQNFTLNLGEILPDPLAIYDIVSIIDQKAIVMWRQGDEWPQNPNNRWDNHAQEMRYSIVDLETASVESFDAFENYAGVSALKPIDGYNYFMTIPKSAPDTEIVLKQNSLYSYTEVTRLKEGSVRTVQRLW